MAQQKSEDRVLPEGGCNAELSVPGRAKVGKGRRDQVEETALQLKPADRDSRKPVMGYPQEDHGSGLGRSGRGCRRRSSMPRT